VRRCRDSYEPAGTRLYLHVFVWPSDGKLRVPGLRNAVEAAYLLADPARKPLATTSAEDGVTVEVPATAPDPISSTVVLEVRGEPDVESAVLGQAADGTVTLPAAEAVVHGGTARYESGPERDNIGFWLQPADWVEWRFKVRAAGRFEVTAQIAALGKGSFRLAAGSSTLSGEAPVTGSFGRFETVRLGVVEIPSAGLATLSVKPVPEGWQPMNLKVVHLRPAK
jgi:alpha-L-fucosidase